MTEIDSWRIAERRKEKGSKEKKGLSMFEKWNKGQRGIWKQGWVERRREGVFEEGGQSMSRGQRTVEWTEMKCRDLITSHE